MPYIYSVKTACLTYEAKLFIIFAHMAQYIKNMRISMLYHTNICLCRYQFSIQHSTLSSTSKYIKNWYKVYRSRVILTNVIIKVYNASILTFLCACIMIHILMLYKNKYF